VEGVRCQDEREVQGVNTVEDLARAQRDWEKLRNG
jgi:GTP:adenosylcobinamide-phosphate guanylyltransferase